MEPETISKNGASLKSQTSKRNIIQKAFLFFAGFFLCFGSTIAQDIITLKNGDDIQALVQEVGDTDIKYKKFDNPTGPNYTLKKSEIFIIRYQNGTKDVFKVETQEKTETKPEIVENKNEKKNVVTFDEGLLEISRNNPTVLLKKGNKVFIEANEDSEGACKEYFIPEMKDWGYWTIVDNINEAHFIIVFNIEIPARYWGQVRTASVIFKTVENQVFKKSKSYKGTSGLLTGLNPYKNASKKIVDNYFKKEFKE